MLCTVSQVRIRSTMLRNRAGAFVRGWFYTPRDAALRVPDTTREHARPVVICEDCKGNAVVVLAVRPDSIEFRFGDGTVVEKSYEAIKDEAIGF
ncbi:hypothetical protein GCM10007385_46470 [Tateyamaria omphalii]|uniref:hypothetical protein n=1 Tax=Tateyamaria omphalii TaxID=299262 RepID=UPI00167630C3|nr:hypothetical protein [Tateyamaria omphalii]GGX72405.1 hypothetical protein GCM10007385_46470 [Tateyamaria omphalii]